MNRAIVIALLALFGALGCKRHEPHRTIALLDVSGSIYPEEVDREFTEVQTLAYSLSRGDQLIIIPITGNARNDTPGHILKLNAPTQRSPFDGELLRFHHDADSQIRAMEDWAKTTPAKRTDIFGTLYLAQMQAGSEQTRTTLLLISDFLEDDGEVRFVSDLHFASTDLAKAYAIRQATKPGPSGAWLNVTFVTLRSKEIAGLTPERIRTVDVFWNETLGVKSTNGPSAGVPSGSK